MVVRVRCVAYPSTETERLLLEAFELAGRLRELVTEWCECPASDLDDAELNRRAHDVKVAVEAWGIAVGAARRRAVRGAAA